MAGGDKTRSAKATGRSEEIPDFFSFFLGHTQDVYFNALGYETQSGMGFHLIIFLTCSIHIMDKEENDLEEKNNLTFYRSQCIGHCIVIRTIIVSRLPQ